MRTALLSILWLLLVTYPAGAMESLATALLGTWHYEGKHMGSTVTSISTFHARENRYASQMKVHFLGKVTTIDFEGAWSIDDGQHVVVKVTKSTSKVFLPVGKVIRMESAKVDGQELHYKHDGKSTKETRVNPNAKKS